MLMMRFLLAFLFFKSIDATAQVEVRKIIHCKIIADSTFVEGVNVLNVLTEQTVISNSKGEFYILAKNDDLLLITAVNLEIKRKLIEEEDLDADIIKIKMIPKMTELKEVNVNENAHLTAENLGIVPKDQKKYTPAERKLKTAGDFKPIDLLQILGGRLPIDPILNAINGRTKRLKKEIIVEKKEYLLVKLNNQFVDNYYIDNLHLPVDYVEGFKYYLIGDETFVAVFLLDDKRKTEFKMSELSVSYNQLLENEN